jgi:hypothetical protein
MVDEDINQKPLKSPRTENLFQEFIVYRLWPNLFEFVPRLRDSCVAGGINAKYRSDSRGVDFVDCPPKRHDHNTT